ncbi:LacI family DNA-binding transcriptional regulator [Nonomuraea sp. NPDC049480]|uniref:LacI family DNA-binding transcriptional regulator n=1 Tax=Nonomuraea sp. NPDC049480 TaxID=3364353 RepID=UPI00379B51F4
MRNVRQGRPTRVTISDVGAAAGVSAATVSRVLNGTAKVDPSLAARVHDAVRQLGYRPNAAAQGLARGKWGTIGVLVPDLANPYFPDVLKAVSAVARSHGRHVMVMESDEDPSVEHDLVEDLMRSCDGVLLCSPRMERSDLVVLTARAHPLVLLDRIVPGLAAPAVAADFFGGMMLICGHLAQLGHRRVAYLSGPEVSWANSERIRALEAAKAFGISVTILPCGSTSRCGYEAAAEVAGTGATALTTYNDLVALGAVTRMRELGVRVPEDLSVVGFDDIELDHVAHTSLTTVSVPRGQLGRQAAELLETLMTEGHDGEPVYLSMELHVRDSTAPPAVTRELAG